MKLIPISLSWDSCGEDSGTDENDSVAVVKHIPSGAKYVPQSFASCSKHHASEFDEADDHISSEHKNMALQSLASCSKHRAGESDNAGNVAMVFESGQWTAIPVPSNPEEATQLLSNFAPSRNTPQMLANILDARADPNIVKAIGIPKRYGSLHMMG